MSLNGKLLSVILALVFCQYGLCLNKYAKDLNGDEEGLTGDRPFRMYKLNLLWEKAKKTLPKVESEELHGELAAQDKRELDLKHKKADGKDKDGSLEAGVRSTMFNILHRYGLTDKIAEYDKEFNEVLKKDIGSKKFNPDKLDKKLTKLWKKAQKSGFTDYELEEFQKELLHQQAKMNEYNLLKREISDEETNDISDNSIDPLKSDFEEPLGRQKKMLKLKEQYRDLKHDFDYLDRQMLMEEASKEFKEPKVMDMWRLAQSANFSEEELSFLKEELKHFEHKVGKHKVLRENLAMSEEQYRSKGRLDDEMPDHHKEMEERVETYGRKVKKYEMDIKMRISKQLQKHTEL